MTIPRKTDRHEYLVLSQKVDGFLPAISAARPFRGILENPKCYPFSSAVQNRYCEFLLDKKRFLEHRKRLSEAKPLVDDRHKGSRRFANVWNPVKDSQTSLQIEGKAAAKADADNEVQLMYINDLDRTFKPFELYRGQHKKSHSVDSLNAIKRKEEVCRISTENLGIYQRLLDQRSSYYHKNYYGSWKAHEDLVAQISRYPHQWKLAKSQEIGKLRLPPIIDQRLVNTQYIRM